MRHEAKRTRLVSRPKSPKSTKSARAAKAATAPRKQSSASRAKPAVRPGPKARKRPPVRKTVRLERKPAPRPPRTPAPAERPDAERVQAALDSLARAQAEVTARGVDLLAVAHELGRHAVQAFKATLVSRLIEDQLLPDLQRLRIHLEQAPGAHSDLQNLPDGALNWFARNLDLSEYLQVGQILEVSGKQLSEFEVEGSPPESEGALVHVRVLRSGWKCRGQVILQPAVAISDAVQATLPPASAPSTSSNSL